MRPAVFSPDRPVEGDLLVVPAGLPGPPSAEALLALRGFAGAGGKLLGLGDGVAWLCAAGLLPGEVTATTPASPTHVRIEGRATAFTWAIPAGRVLPLRAAEAMTSYAAPDATVLELEAQGRVVLRYCDVAGGLRASSRRELAAHVAGLCDEGGGVLGLLAPEHPSLDSELGRQILACLLRR